MCAFSNPSIFLSLKKATKKLKKKKSKKGLMCTIETTTMLRKPCRWFSYLTIKTPILILVTIHVNTMTNTIKIKTASKLTHMFCRELFSQYRWKWKICYRVFANPLLYIQLFCCCCSLYSWKERGREKVIRKDEIIKIKEKMSSHMVYTVYTRLLD